MYDLEVHKEELEIQNEELRQVQIQLQLAIDRYADLYDFAPVGYVTVDSNGLVPDLGIDGKVRGIHLMCIDVTERKLVERQNLRRRMFVERLVCLSATERDVYEFLIRGKSNKFISEELDIGLRTAERRRKQIFEKLEVAAVAELLQEIANIQGIGTA